ncbi:hypothetical protein NZD86_00140 [Alicyclobacillus dauci]|uniref:HD-CE domain-containing protein n=1 Tax=Alicyclobacillus dauci TaxID=1475485 RepID=A0ABY6Z2Q3_9BACL|nr:hypothetical protein [Alicyclobacillus dauci]WAH37029.1 hypothetical protein NZD86_00140 [Alicyclobacillus dauci]
MFSACYLHDIGMLTSPKRRRLHDQNKDDIKHLQETVSGILEVAASNSSDTGLIPQLALNHIYDIHSSVERLREEIVRTEHPFVSEKELVSDYPKLPLSVAERRDIGVISSAHGKLKQEVAEIPEELHDGVHPINLRLLSLLLRIADLSDVSKDRVRQEVLERHYDNMSKYSIFHWVKHLSVDDFTIERQKTDMSSRTVVTMYIEHNYLPVGNLPKDILHHRCGNNCKLKYKEKYVTKFMLDGKK